MIIDTVEIAVPKYNATDGEFNAMVRFDYRNGMGGTTGQINLICRTSACEFEAAKVIKERLMAHAIYQLKWMPEFQKGDDSLTVSDVLNPVEQGNEPLRNTPQLAVA